MADSLVFTIIGPDRPGLVEQIARAVNEHEANWLGSRMSQLGGNFAGMIHVEGQAEQLDALREALHLLPGLSMVAEPGIAEAETTRNTMAVTMLGLDRPGIVREVSAALVDARLNVLDLQTEITAAAMTGDPLFNGRAVVAFEAAQDLSELAARLDEISQALGVDIELLEDEDG